MDSLNDLHIVCIQVFGAVSKATSFFIMPLFIGRIVTSNVLGEGSKAFGAIKGAVIYFILVAGFPLIVDILFSIPNSFLPKFESIRSLSEDSPGASLGIIPFALDKVLEVALAGLYWVSYYLHVFFMLTMCSMAPVVFLTSTFLGVGLGIEIFMGLLIAGSSWPLIWYGFDQVHSHLVSAQSDAFGAKCLELLITLFKGLSPVAFAAIAVKSPAGKLIGKTAQATIAAGRWSTASVINAPGRIAQTQRDYRSTNYQRRSQSSTKNPGLNGFLEKLKKDRLSAAKGQTESKGESKRENPRPRNT